MKRAVIVHGWEGKPNEGWQLWLRNELVRMGFQVLAPAMPQPALPKLDQWLLTLTETIGQPDSDTYLIGHSLGCYTILKYLEQLPTGEKIGGVVLVAGFAGNLKHNIPILRQFYESGLDWDKVRGHGGKFIAIGSERDDYVHIQSLYEFKEKLDAKIIINNDWRHFSAIEGISAFPDVLQSVLEMSR